MRCSSCLLSHHAVARLGGLLLVALFACSLLATPALAADKFTVTEKPEEVEIKLNGKPFTNYLIGPEHHKPILWPILGPNDELMTRSYPMKDVGGEDKDHIHHRSLWFTHGNVNGVSFWDEKSKSGNIKHVRFGEVEGGETAKIRSFNEWRDAQNKLICEDERVYTFRANGDQRIIDVEVILKAGKEPVIIGDTKEGSFGVRVAESMRVDPLKKRAKIKGEPLAKGEGTIVNSHGQRNAAAWGQRADWVDYYGPVNGKKVGIAIMNHPTSFRYPTYWHVRTYGLFAANPFGPHDFDNKNDKNGVTIEPGKSLTLRYRVLLHNGDEKQGGVAASFDDYKALYK